MVFNVGDEFAPFSKKGPQGHCPPLSPYSKADFYYTANLWYFNTCFGYKFDI